MDDHWYFARNASQRDGPEGMVLASRVGVVKRIPGQETVSGFEEGPCAVATHDFTASTCVCVCVCVHAMHLCVCVCTEEKEISF